MQITKVEVVPVELKLRQPVRMAHLPPIEHVTAVFIHMETRQGHNAWGCAVAHPDLTGEQPKNLIRACRECADLVPSLHPTHIEYSMNELSRVAGDVPSALCAYDLAFHDLLGLAADMPLYRLLGGFRNSIRTSATIPLGSVAESVELARARANLGYRILKIKGGLDPEEDVRRVQAIHRALPSLTLRLDADGGYQVGQALDVVRALQGVLEMLEQPTAPDDLEALAQVTRLSSVPILADQSITGLASALKLAANHSAGGICIKLAACEGLRCARQMDAIARAAQMATMVSCLIEPALLTAAGLSFALSSPNVQFGDLDGYLDLTNDPSQPTFRFEDGWLVASEVPGLGCSVDI